MPKVEGGKIWLTEAELIEFGLPINTIRHGTKRHRKLNTSSWQHKPHPEDRRVKLINYDSIPAGTREKLPTKQELIEEYKAQQSESRYDAADMITKAHTGCLRIEDGQYFRSKGLSGTDKVNDLMMAAAWLRLLAAYKSKKDTLTLGAADKKQLREIVIQLILEQDMQRRRQLYGFKVSNVTVLQRKELKWAKSYKQAFEQHSNLSKIQAEQLANEAALDTLLHANTGNNNRRIVGALNPDPFRRILIAGGRIDLSEWHARTMIYLKLNPGSGGQFDFEEIHWRYSKMCKEEGKQPVSLSEVKHFLNLKEVKQHLTRESRGYASLDKDLPHIYGARPTHSLLKGGYDGFQVDFRTNTDAGTIMLTCVAVFDYHSEAITGLAIGRVENGKLVREMYLDHLNKWGKSYIEIESDRFSGNLAAETKPIFENTCRYITQPSPKDAWRKAPNPKARFVERILQEFNRIIQKGDFQGWKGTNITAIDKKRKPNPDYNIQPVASEEEGIQQIIKLVAIYNNTKKFEGKRRIEQFKEKMHFDAPVIPHTEVSLLLRQYTQKQVLHGKIEIKVNKVRYEYSYPEYIDHRHLMLKGSKVKVCYDEQDMSTVDIFGKDDVYLATLGKLERVARDKYTLEHNPEEQKKLGKMENARKEAEEKLSRKALEVEASMYDIDISNLPVEEAYRLVLGARNTYRSQIIESPEERFAEELATVDAQQTVRYYEDRMRNSGMKVPATADKSKEEKRREYFRNKSRKK